MSPELETLDQLLGGDLLLVAVRGLYPDVSRFARGLSALLASGDVRLVEGDAEVPAWQWGAVLAAPEEWARVRVRLSRAGANRIR
jgi:hypothetical protein